MVASLHKLKSTEIKTPDILRKAPRILLPGNAQEKTNKNFIENV